MEFTTREELMAYAIGMEVLKYLKTEDTMKTALAEMESRAVQVLEEIQEVLNDGTLDDPNCFLRIEAIVNIYLKNYIGTNRHDW